MQMCNHQFSIDKYQIYISGQYGVNKYTQQIIKSITPITLCLKQTLDFFFVTSVPTMPKILYDL